MPNSCRHDEESILVLEKVQHDDNESLVAIVGFCKAVERRYGAFLEVKVVTLGIAASNQMTEKAQKDVQQDHSFIILNMQLQVAVAIFSAILSGRDFEIHHELGNV